MPNIIVKSIIPLNKIAKLEFVTNFSQKYLNLIFDWFMII